jgi:hypothetical protein
MIMTARSFNTHAVVHLPHCYGLLEEPVVAVKNELAAIAIVAKWVYCGLARVDCGKNDRLGMNAKEDIPRPQVFEDLTTTFYHDVRVRVLQLFGNGLEKLAPATCGIFRN